MKRRIAAWILLAGFLGLLINIIFIGKFLIQSLIVYTIIAVLFFIFSNVLGARKTNDIKKDELRKGEENEF